MKLPISWLKEYIAVPAPEKLAELLTMSGSKVERIEQKHGVAVLEIEVTTNRADCLGILGLAAEVRALTKKKIRFPKVSKVAVARGASNFKIRVEDPQGCPKYTARLIQNVRVTSSPERARSFLELAGVRPICNVVDATNFVLFEMGQPLHAFDYDKIKGGVIVVRRARLGEKILGIDGVEYTLDTKTLVIADAQGPVAIAGVIGGKATEVTPQTKNILLESAYFEPRLVRRASKDYKLSTDSSYRFERGVNPHAVETASARATDLVLAWAGGSASIGLFTKNCIRKFSPKKIALRADRVADILGVGIRTSRISSVLKDLGFRLESAGKGGFLVTPPPARRDVLEPVDLVEEVLRVEGFGKIPQTLPRTRYTTQTYSNAQSQGVRSLKRYLAALGLDEIVTYGLLSAKAISDSGFNTVDCVKIQNPASAEQEYLRPSLLPGMLQSVIHNVHRKASSLWFFEIGKKYLKDREETVLGIALYGTFEENWRRKSEVSYYELKGVVENVLSFLRSRTAVSMDVVSQEILRKWDIPRDVFFAEIILEGVFERARRLEPARVKSVPKFPSVTRDIAFVIDENVSVKELEALMKSAASGYSVEVRLFDQYTGKGIPPGRRSLAFSLEYQKETSTFTDEEIQTLQARVAQVLKERYSVEFRS